MGFLVYVAGTYTMFTPYLKGIYLTLNSWRPGRTADGWPLPGFERDMVKVAKDHLAPPPPPPPPHLGEGRPAPEI